MAHGRAQGGLTSPPYENLTVQNADGFHDTNATTIDWKLPVCSIPMIPSFQDLARGLHLDATDCEMSPGQQPNPIPRVLPSNHCRWAQVCEGAQELANCKL
jgi:hypothetical protein